MDIRKRLKQPNLTHLVEVASTLKPNNKGTVKKTSNKNKIESIEEGLARSQSLLRFEGDEENMQYFLSKQEMLDDLEDNATEAELRSELVRSLAEFQTEDLVEVDSLMNQKAPRKGIRFLRAFVMSAILLNQAKARAKKNSLARIVKLAEAYGCYQDRVKEKALSIITEELIEYSLSESSWQEIRAHRHSPNIRSIAIERIRTYSLKHTISQRYSGSCFTLQVRSLEQKELSHSRNELLRMDAGQIKDALLAEHPNENREKLLNQISMQYICDQIVSKEGGFKFQAKLATAYRVSSIISTNNLKAKSSICYDTLLVKGVKL